MCGFVVIILAIVGIVGGGAMIYSLVKEWNETDV